MLWLLLISGVLWLAYKYFTAVFSYWKKKGVPHIPGSFPFGSDSRLTTMSQYPGYTQDEMYKAFPNEPYFGTYLMRLPFLVVKSPEIISIILTKEFSHFRDRQFIKIHKDDFLAQHLFNVGGDHWRAMRMKLAPTFTSGKLKGMFPLFVKCTENLDSYLSKKSESVIEAKDLAARFTTDIICSCAFGIEGSAIENPDDELRKRSMNAFIMSIITILKITLKNVLPELAHLIPTRLFDKDVEKFFVKLVRDSLKNRENAGFKRNDFLDLLIELKNKGPIDDIKEELAEPLEVTDELMTANCFIFFAAGFETSSSVQSFCLYELALNPDIQQRLQAEIDEVLTKYGGVTYESIKHMTYLDMVIKEAMRKYPTLPALTRICTKSLELQNGFVVEEGDCILIPVWSLHHDPEYFPEPNKFDPGRFSEENKDLIRPYTYLPFGEGPRFCIGMRFGMLQTKMGLITILRKYSVEATKDTCIKLGLKGPSFVTMPKDPINVKLVPRHKR